MVYCLFGGVTHAIRRGSEIPFVDGRIKTSNAILDAFELNSSCSGKAHSKEHSTIGMKTQSVDVFWEYCQLRI